MSTSLSALPPLSLYIHIPWCVRKCPYCDFNSHQAKTELNENAYIDALLKDLQYELPYFWGRAVETIFIGGGTPSLFQAASIDKLLSGIRALTRLHPDAEITLESNPGTFERQKFEGFQQAGINRLSIGVQSFNDSALAALGRIHNHREAQIAIETALSLFDKVNIDLMYALPRQTVELALADVQTAINTGATHISAYHLTMEPNTPFGHHPPAHLPEEEAALDIEAAVHQTLIQAGFEHYETSAFARPQQECRHNVNYWQFGDYIGIGAGAHGKISSHACIERTVRKRHPNDYLYAMQHHPAQAVTRKPIALDELPFEFMMNALRLSRGVPTAWFSERTGLSIAKIAPQLMAAQQADLLDGDPRYLKATAKGQRFLNDLLHYFL